MGHVESTQKLLTVLCSGILSGRDDLENGQRRNVQMAKQTDLALDMVQYWAFMSTNETSFCIYSQKQCDHLPGSHCRFLAYLQFHLPNTEEAASTCMPHTSPT